MSPVNRPTDVRHPIFGRFYRRLAAGMEGRGLAENRAELVAGLAGTIVEVGAGDGALFAHYPSTVTRVVAVEPEPYLRARAREAAVSAPVPVEVVDATAERLPVADASVDAVVFCLVLCSVADPGAAATEAVRVVRTDGEVRVLEHVVADAGSRMAALQSALDRTVWPRLFGGCHCGRDSLAALESAGLDVVDLRRFPFPDKARTPVSPHISARLRVRSVAGSSR